MAPKIAEFCLSVCFFFSFFPTLVRCPVRLKEQDPRGKLLFFFFTMAILNGLTWNLLFGRLVEIRQKERYRKRTIESIQNTNARWQKWIKTEEEEEELERERGKKQQTSKLNIHSIENFPIMPL